MITIEGPHMGLNDSRAVNRVNMFRNLVVAPSDSPASIIMSVAANARQVQGGKFRNVVFNCHGLPSSLQMGAGFNRSHTILFINLQGMVDKIWLYACEVASTVVPGGFDAGDGNAFCSEIARAAQCYVVARPIISSNVAPRALHAQSWLAANEHIPTPAFCTADDSTCQTFCFNFSEAPNICCSGNTIFQYNCSYGTCDIDPQQGDCVFNVECE